MTHLYIQEQEVLGLLQQPHKSRVKVDSQQLQLRGGLLMELQQGLVELLIRGGGHLVRRSDKPHRRQIRPDHHHLSYAATTHSPQLLPCMGHKKLAG